MGFTQFICSFLDTLIPDYARVPLILVVLLNFLTFNGTRLINRKKKHYDFSTAVDHVIPFWPPAVLIYVSAFAQWVICYILIARSSKEICYSFTSGDLIAKLICMICFIVIPTRTVRPAIHVRGFFTGLTRFIFWVDTPDNLFPSIHCLESWICMHAALCMPHMPMWFRIGMCILTILVCASTVLLKQHVFVDVVAGIAAAEIGLYIAHFSGFSHVLSIWSQQINQVISHL